MDERDGLESGQSVPQSWLTRQLASISDSSAVRKKEDRRKAATRRPEIGRLALEQARRCQQRFRHR